MGTIVIFCVLRIFAISFTLTDRFYGIFILKEEVESRLCAAIIFNAIFFEIQEKWLLDICVQFITII